MPRRLSSVLIFLMVAFAFTPAQAQDAKFSKQQLDQMLAPIALYPDDLLTNVLMASTYPLDVVQAARWRKEGASSKLTGDKLAKALEAKTWDPSIKALVQFPDVLENMSEQLEWTQKLGDAFLAQQDEVMDQIQYLRSKADAAGHLKSNKQQTVSKEADDVIVIEPASSDIVYVPVYEPSDVYGPWWYPEYPPYYWPYPDAVFDNGYYWGAGIAIAAGIWGWNHFDWHRHNIDIDANKWNNINANRERITNNKWQHRPDQRGSVPYRSKEVRDKFKPGERQIGDKDFRGKDREKIEQRLKDTDHARVEDRQRNAGDRAGDRDRAPQQKKQGSAQKRQGASKKAASRDIARPKAKKPSPGGFDVKRGSDVRKQASRGHASRTAMAQPRGGGGPRRGGGGRGGGGRRR